MAVDLSKRTALVVGGAHGYGRGAVDALSAAGARVYLADLDLAEAITAATAACADGGAVSALALDPSRAADWDTALSTILEERGVLEVLVYATTAAPAADLYETEPDLWARVMSATCTGFYLGARTVLPAMAAQRHGVVVVIGAQMGACGDHLSDSAGQAALATVVRCVSRQHAAEGVRVCAVNPSWSDDAAARPAVREVGDAVALLCAEDARGLNGVLLEVAGGQRTT